MSRQIINAPSLANVSLFELKEQVALLVEGGVNFFHIDIMDGHYVPNICFPVSVAADLLQEHPDAIVDAHLMVEDPGSYASALAAAGVQYASFHSDSTKFARRVLRQYKDHGMKAGVAINPSMPIDTIVPYIQDLDYVVLMTVEPGFAGQSFLDGSLERLEELADLRKAHGAQFLIQIDGGVDDRIGAECVARGADILVTGKFAVFSQPEGVVAAVRRFDAAMATAQAALCAASDSVKQDEEGGPWEGLRKS